MQSPGCACFSFLSWLKYKVQFVCSSLFMRLLSMQCCAHRIPIRRAAFIEQRLKHRVLWAFRISVNSATNHRNADSKWTRTVVYMRLFAICFDRSHANFLECTEVKWQKIFRDNDDDDDHGNGWVIPFYFRNLLIYLFIYLDRYTFFGRSVTRSLSLPLACIQ